MSDMYVVNILININPYSPSSLPSLHLFLSYTPPPEAWSFLHITDHYQQKAMLISNSYKYETIIRLRTTPQTEKKNLRESSQGARTWF